MIGTHNSMTCYESEKWWFKPFKFMWRCQDKFLVDQVCDGVKYFDIRIRFDKKGNVKFCHGLVDLKVRWDIPYLLDYFERYGCKCRIIVERGSSCGIFDLIPLRYLTNGTVREIIEKKGWKVLHSFRNQMQIKDYCYVPFHSDKSFWWNIRHMQLSTIKKWAKKNNPLFNDFIRHDTTVHFVDYFE